MLNPIYEDPSLSPQPDIYGAVYDFVLNYGLPALPPENIIRTWQNRAALPPDDNEFAVISLLGVTRRGSGVETLLNTGVPETEAESYQVRAYYEAVARVDFCSDSDLGRQRAVSLESLSRSGLGVWFFRPRGLSLLYAEPIRETSSTDEADQYVLRHSLDLRLAYWAGLDVKSAWIAVGPDDPGLIINPVKGLPKP